MLSLVSYKTSEWSDWKAWHGQLEKRGVYQLEFEFQSRFKNISILKLIISLETTSSIHTNVAGYDDNGVNYNLCYSTGHPPSPSSAIAFFQTPASLAKTFIQSIQDWWFTQPVATAWTFNEILGHTLWLLLLSLNI